MTDLEITKLCAKAMVLSIAPHQKSISWTKRDTGLLVGPPHEIFDPLHDDAQAMAMVKKFHIALGWNDPGWAAFRQDTKRWVNNADLNAAICDCVAKMQAAK